MLTTILLYGELAEKFGPVWNLAVSSVGEAIRAIEANRPGLIGYLGDSGERGVDFRVQVDDIDTTDEDRLRMNRRIGTIKISPVVRGSKDAWVRVVVGIVLIIVAVVAQQYYSLPGIFSGIAGAGGYASAITNAIGVMGISLALGGVAQMIAGTPKAPSSVDDGSGKQSYLFGGPENTTTQGGPVPLCYGGPILVGSQVISAGIYTEDTSIAPTIYTGGEDVYLDGPFWGSPIF
jgi:predicted phage tail protein